MAVLQIIFDKENKQDDYQYIARDMNGKLQIFMDVIVQKYYNLQYFIL